jgi:hypothetical protein
MTEFIDTSTENEHTFSRRFPLHVLKWIHSVLVKHEMRTGDPFVLINRRYIDTVLKDPQCIELFAAMNLGFAPEMNFLDTVAWSPQYGLADSLNHQYHRNARLEATTEDIGPANAASAIERRFFMRKTSPLISEDFVRYFSTKIAADWPRDNASFVLDVAVVPILPAADLPGLRELLGPNVNGSEATLRKLTGDFIARIRFGADFRIWVGAEDIGGWSIDEAGLSLDFLVHDWGVKLYERPMSTADKITLAPAEIVSVRNGWSVIVDFDISTLLEAHMAPEFVIEPYVPTRPLGGWSFSHSATASLMDAFVGSGLDDYPTDVRHADFDGLELRAEDGLVLALGRVEGCPVLLRYTGFVFAAHSCKALFERASVHDAAMWSKAAPVKVQMAIKPSDLVGHYILQLLDRSTAIELVIDGRIRDPDGNSIGFWFADRGAVRLFGIPGLRTGLVGQFQRRNNRLHLSGWGWRDIQNAVTFALEMT